MHGSIITTGIIGAASLIGAGLWYVGVFRKVKITSGRIGATKYVYVRGTGSYKNVGAEFERVIAIAKETGFKVKRTAGMYFDDPSITPSEKLRWSAGFLVEEDEEKVLKKFDLKKHGMQLKKLSSSSSAVAVFPNVLPPLTYMIAAFKVYAAFEKQNEFKIQSGSFEVYDFEDWNIYIHFPQENCKEYMPEE